MMYRCVECGNVISSAVQVCPNCGDPAPHRMVSRNFWGVCKWLLIIAAVGWVLEKLNLAH
jgi:RNA polymerase subunit RPABC4/transcription elongation factor Spt4